MPARRDPHVRFCRSAVSSGRKALGRRKVMQSVAATSTSRSPATLGLRVSRSGSLPRRSGRHAPAEPPGSGAPDGPTGCRERCRLRWFPGDPRPSEPYLPSWRQWRSSRSDRRSPGRRSKGCPAGPIRPEGMRQRIAAGLGEEEIGARHCAWGLMLRSKVKSASRKPALRRWRRRPALNASVAAASSGKSYMASAAGVGPLTNLSGERGDDGRRVIGLSQAARMRLSKWLANSRMSSVVVPP